MKKLFFLFFAITGLISCNEQEDTPIIGVIDRITYHGLSDYATIYFTNGISISKAPNWLRSSGYREGDTIPESLFREEWPDILYLQPVYREDILDSETREVLCIRITYEDKLGRIVSKRNYKSTRQIPLEIKFCQGGFDYFECSKE